MHAFEASVVGLLAAVRNQYDESAPVRGQLSEIIGNGVWSGDDHWAATVTQDKPKHVRLTVSRHANDPNRRSQENFYIPFESLDGVVVHGVEPA